MLFSIVSYALRSDFRAEVVKKKKKSDQDARCLTFHKTKEEKKKFKTLPYSCPPLAAQITCQSFALHTKKRKAVTVD